MFSLFAGPHPPRDLIDERPETISAEAAVRGWRAGYLDGYRGLEVHIFEGFQAELQPIYNDGWGRGYKDKQDLAATAGRPGGTDASTKIPSAAMHHRIGRQLRRGADALDSELSVRWHLIVLVMWAASLALLAWNL